MMKRYSKQYRKFFCILLIVAVLLSTLGCGQQGGPGAVSPSGETANQENGETTVIGTQWKSAGFSYTEKDFLPSEQTQSFQEIRGSVLEDTEPEFHYTDKRRVVAYLRDTCYVLYSYRQQQGQRFVLEKRKSDVEKPKQLELFGEPDQVPTGYVACMDVVTESDIAVLFVSTSGNWSGEAREYLLLHLDGKGNILSRTELMASYQEQGMESHDLVQGFWQCDEQGYSYVLTNERKTLTIFDAAGNFVKKQDYSGEEYVTVEAAFHAPDGSLIFSRSDSGQGTTTLIWLDTEKKQWKELVSIRTPYLKQFSMLEDGQIYYTRGGNLIKWDVQTGGQEWICYGLPSGFNRYVAHVSVTKQGELILYIVGRDQVDVRVLSDQETETEGIVLLDLVNQSPFLQSRAAEFNREGGNVNIQYKTGKGDNETAWTRTMAEFAAGKGPDMLCLQPDDGYLQTLYEKGVLADLRGLMPEEILDQIFPGILEGGTVDGTLVGLGVDAMANVLVTSNELWPQDTWTVEDIMGIAQAHPDLEGMLLFDKGTTNPAANLWWMGIQHMENSPFVDFRKKESHFADTQFPKFLELAKKYGELPAPAEDTSTLVREGRCIAAHPELIMRVENFVETVEKYGEECHFIGFPGQTDHVGYWRNYYVIVVNKKSEYLDTIVDFLSYLLSEECQQKVFQLSVREDVMRQYETWNDWTGEGRWYYLMYGGYGEDKYWVDFTKPNGESYIEDYMDFLRKLGPSPGNGSVISDIAYEEAEYYFNGSKSAEQVAGIIDSRVQMYLNE